jgi:hypothetical protein
VKKATILIQSNLLFYALLFFIPLAFVLITGFNGLYGQDAHEYFRYSKALHEFFVSGKNPGDYFWPVLFPLAGALLSFVFSAIFSLQLTSILSFVISIYLLEKILNILYLKSRLEIRTYLVLLFFLSPYLLRASMVVMSDMLSLMFVLAAFYFFYKHWYFRRNKFLVAFTAFSTAAIATRYASFILLAIPAVIILSRFVKKFSLPVLLLTIVVSAIIIAPHLLIRQSNPTAFLHNSWLENWSMKNLFLATFDTQDGHAKYLFPNFIYAFFNWFHPGFLFAGILLFVFVKKVGYRRNTIRIIIGSVFLYAIFIAGIPYQNLRFLILPFPLVLIILFPVALDILRKFSTKQNQWIIGFVSIMQLVIFIRVFIPFYQLNKLEKAIVYELRDNKENGPVYTFEMEGALHSYGVRNEIYGLWDKECDSIKTPALLLFNEDKFSKQWVGTKVMANYEEIKKRKLTDLRDFGYGWKLSKIE